MMKYGISRGIKGMGSFDATFCSLKLHKCCSFVSNRHKAKVGQSEKFGFIGHLLALLTSPTCCQVDQGESSLEILYMTMLNKVLRVRSITFCYHFIPQILLNQLSPMSIRCGICGLFFLWLSTSCSQVIIKRSSNENFSHSE